MPDSPRKLRVIDSPDPDRPAPVPEPPRAKLQLGRKEIVEVNRTQEAATKPITVHAILAENLRHTTPKEKPLDLRRRRSRRALDYWLLLGVGDGICATAVVLYRDNPFILTSAIAGGTVFTVGLTWVMWKVMSDY